VEHDDRAPVATFFAAGPFAAGAVVTLAESQAHHARVKRLDEGDVVRLTSGSGHLATGVIAALKKSAVDVTVQRIAPAGARPGVHLRVPIGDRERMLWLAEKATELGIASWQAVRFRRSASVSPRGEGPAFADKIRARMVSALEQSGGAWLPTLLPETTPDCIDVDTTTQRIVLDAAGAPLPQLLALDAARNPVIVFGPEGGLDADERAALTAAGWAAARLAPTTLRFETAGVAAVAIARAAHLPRES
jgi:16S rRNA (uracil1498-N3)-methyltransferase